MVFGTAEKCQRRGWYIKKVTCAIDTLVWTEELLNQSYFFSSINAFLIFWSHVCPVVGFPSLVVQNRANSVNNFYHFLQVPSFLSLFQQTILATNQLTKSVTAQVRRFYLKRKNKCFRLGLRYNWRLLVSWFIRSREGTVDNNNNNNKNNNSNNNDNNNTKMGRNNNKDTDNDNDEDNDNEIVILLMIVE